MERPRMFLVTEETNLTAYQPVLVAKVSDDAQGISYLVLSIDPDPNALYALIIAKVLTETELEVTAIWSLQLPHLTAGVYAGFKAGDYVAVFHRTTDPAITVKTGVSLAFNEVIA